MVQTRGADEPQGIYYNVSALQQISQPLPRVLDITLDIRFAARLGKLHLAAARS